MSVIAAALKHMLAAGMPHEAIVQAVADMENGLQRDEQAERRRAADRDRKREKRLRNSAESADKVDVPRVGVTRVEDKTLTSEIEPQLEKQTKRATSALDGFEEWYRAYPHKVQRGAAERAWPKARFLASQAELLDGLRRYISSKPLDRPWQNPATWLNGKGWLDQPSAVQPRGSPFQRQPSAADLAADLLRQMEQPDASTASEIEGHSTALVRFPRIASG